MANEQPPQLNLPTEAQWGPGFDVAKATDAYVATIPAAEREKSDAYFEGGYWLDAWATLITVAIAWLLLRTGVAARLRDWTERRFRRRFLQVFVFAAGIFLALGLLMLPWTLYTGYFREHQYGMSNQDLAGFLRDTSISLALLLAVAAFAAAGIYALLRRVGERWIYWATAATVVFTLLIMLVTPVFVAPLFNDYHSLPEGELRQSILALAKESGIPATDVSWFDASRQTKRISANVSGLAGTMRIALNDNLLNGTTLPEIRAVLAHEMGHYVKNHSVWIPLGFSFAIGIGYWFVNRLFGFFQHRFGARWGVKGLADPAGLPLAFAIFTVVMLLLTPVTNNIVRLCENQADAYGLDAAKEPHGFASIAMRLANYRKIEPSPVEEFIFFDHPSGRARVERAMQWLADHPPAPQP